MYDVYGFIRGPMVWLSFAIFFGGLLYQARQFYVLTMETSLPRPPASVTGLAKGAVKRSSFDPRTMLFASAHPVLAVITTAFHACIIILPVFLLAHNVLLFESFGFSLFVFPEPVAGLMTWLVIFCGIFFLLRRILFDHVRAISTPYDYAILLIVIAPFLTGYLATRQWFGYESILVLHILAGELMLVAIPFTKLKHGLLFFFYRYLMHYEHTLGRGSRTWSGTTLHKRGNANA
ncbi:MAG: hypothetical protein JW781_02830 [Deltaproteobacteria bacterium]|nr:hypothetical protein [Candidatus Anaeroferrophillacea bacterium]